MLSFPYVNFTWNSWKWWWKSIPVPFPFFLLIYMLFFIYVLKVISFMLYIYIYIYCWCIVFNWWRGTLVESLVQVLQVWIGPHNERDNRIEETGSEPVGPLRCLSQCLLKRVMKTRQEYKECKSCVTRMWECDLYYIGMEQ